MGIVYFQGKLLCGTIYAERAGNWPPHAFPQEEGAAINCMLRYCTSWMLPKYCGAWCFS